MSVNIEQPGGRESWVDLGNSPSFVGRLGRNLRRPASPRSIGSSFECECPLHHELSVGERIIIAIKMHRCLMSGKRVERMGTFVNDVGIRDSGIEGEEEHGDPISMNTKSLLMIATKLIK